MTRRAGFSGHFMPCSRHEEQETLFCQLYVLLLVFCPFVSAFVNGFWAVDGEPLSREASGNVPLKVAKSKQEEVLWL